MKWNRPIDWVIESEWERKWERENGGGEREWKKRRGKKVNQNHLNKSQYQILGLW